MTKDNKIKKDVKREFPDSYYVNYEEGISRASVDEVLAKQYKHIITKLKKSVAFKLKISVDDNEAMDVINDALVSTVKSFEKSPEKFKNQRDFFAYWLLSSWREYRNQKIKLTKKKKDADKLEYREKILVSLDSILELVDESTEAQDSLGIVDEDYFKSEDFKAFVHDRVYEYLDDCYLDGAYTLREVAIFKIYCVNNYSYDKMVEETSFGRTSIITAVSKIKKHLKTVDFRWEQFQLTRKES